MESEKRKTELVVIAIQRTVFCVLFLTSQRSVIKNESLETQQMVMPVNNNGS